MRLVFAGTGDISVVALEAFLVRGHEVVAVLTREDAFLGRKRILTSSPVAVCAEKYGIPVVKANKIDSFVQAKLRSFLPDFIPVVAYGVLIPEEALTIPVFSWVNLHFSSLPKWRGAAPVQRAIMAGETSVGLTVFEIEKGLDTGPCFANIVEPIFSDESSGDVLKRLSYVGADLLVDTVEKIQLGSVCAVAQNGQVSFAPKLTLEDGCLNWGLDASSLHAIIRGVNPEPGAWTNFRQQRLKIFSAKVREDVLDLVSGKLLVGCGVDKTVLVGTATCALELVEVQAAGKKVMGAMDWARGSSVSGEMFT